MALEVEVVPKERLPAMAGEWDALALADPRATAYQGHAISMAGWQIDAAEMPVQPLVITMRDPTGSLRGLAPLAGWTRRRHGIPWRMITGLAGDWISAWDVVCAPGFETDVVACLCRWLAEARDAFDQFRIRRIRADAHAATLAESLSPPLVTRRVRDLPPAHRLVVEPAWQSIDDHLSNHARKRLRQTRQRMDREVGVVIRGAELDPTTAARHLAALHLARWGDDHSEFGVASRTDGMARLLERWQDAGTGGYLELATGDGVPVAATTWFRLGRRAALYRAGYDPAWHRHSPGSLLMHEVLNRLIREGVDVVDFGYGDDDYKDRWSSETSPMAFLSLCSPRLRTWTARAALAAFSRTGLTDRRYRWWDITQPGRAMGG